MHRAFKTSILNIIKCRRQQPQQQQQQYQQERQHREQLKTVSGEVDVLRRNLVQIAFV